MLKENKILIDNIKYFRNHLMINESISESDIRKYMENHEFVYIFYGGDGQNPRGWRTIRPYVLGVINGKENNIGVRAWQDKGRSVSKDITKLRGNEHDFWYDNLDNKQKPGWRMFRLDKIEQIYPTGKKFVDGKGNVIFPPKYNFSGDKDMSSIMFQVTDKKEPDVNVTSNDLKVTQKRERKDWSVFQNANANRRKITPQEISNFKRIASNILKKKADNLVIAINNRNEFELIDVKNVNKIPKEAVVGSLSRLYDKEVRKGIDSKADRFHDQQRNISLNEIKDNKIRGFPYNINSFFKT